MTTGTIFLVAVVKAIIMGAFEMVTGRDMFPANPKGPLYKWFGKPKA